MKKLVLMLLLTGAAAAVPAAELTWFTDLPKAQAQAKQENKLLLLDFTGSDWCGWCIRFNKEVLTTPKFAEYAKKHLVLVELDFPRHKSQGAEQKAANKALSEKYNVEGFPTFVVLNGAGKEVWRQVGYLEGGPQAFIAELEKAAKK